MTGALPLSTNANCAKWQVPKDEILILEREDEPDLPAPAPTTRSISARRGTEHLHTANRFITVYLDGVAKGDQPAAKYTTRSCTRRSAWRRVPAQYPRQGRQAELPQTSAGPSSVKDGTQFFTQVPGGEFRRERAHLRRAGEAQGASRQRRPPQGRRYVPAQVQVPRRAARTTRWTCCSTSRARRLRATRLYFERKIEGVVTIPTGPSNAFSIVVVGHRWKDVEGELAWTAILCAHLRAVA